MVLHQLIQDSDIITLDGDSLWTGKVELVNSKLDNITVKHMTGTAHDKNQWVHAGGRGSKFDMLKWEHMSVPERSKAWAAMSVADRDKMTEADASITRVMDDRLKGIGKRPTGTPDEVITQRMDQVKELIQTDSAEMISDRCKQLAGFLKEAGVDDKLASDLMLDAVDALVVQENESYSRTLGDHGARHILGNMDTALQIMDAIPGADTPDAKAAVALAAVFHDTGYLTGPAQIFLDEGHPRWSKQHYDANLRDKVTGALGKEWAGYISDMIVSHADSSLDWKNDIVASSLRLADNLALFHKEKLPPLFKYVPESIGILKDMGQKKLDVDSARKQVMALVQKLNIPQAVKTNLLQAAKELSAITPKFTLGMLAGDIGKILWKGNKLVVQLNRNATAQELQKILDLGQRQFIKFAESYGIDPKQLETDSLSIGDGLVIEITGEKLKALLFRLGYNT